MGDKDGKDAIIRNRIFVVHDLLVKKCHGKNETQLQPCWQIMVLS